MKNNQTKKIKEGDWIIITNPKLFERCGYPLTPNMVRNEVLITFKEQLDAFRKIYACGNIGVLLTLNTDLDSCPQVESIVSNLCKKLVADRGFGGNERQIFQSNPHPNLLNLTVQVRKIKRIVTGTYNRAYHDYDDYSPAYLSNQKSHTLFGFNPIHTISSELMWILKDNTISTE